MNCNQLMMSELHLEQEVMVQYFNQLAMLELYLAGMKITVSHLLIKLAILPPISLFVRHISDQTKSYVYIGGNLGLTPFNVIVANTQ